MAESFAIWIENTVGKGEIAHYKQFLIFPLCFQKTCTADMYKPGLVWERLIDWLIEWHFTLLSTVFQSYHGDNSHYSCLSWVSPVLGWGSEVSCPRILPRKNPEDTVRLETRIPGLRFKHSTSEPCRTPVWERVNFPLQTVGSVVQ